MKHLLLLIFLISSTKLINAQGNVPILERRITIKVTNQPLGKVLNIISETANFNFSYASNVVKVNRVVSVHAENRTVKEVLDQLFNNEVTYQQIGNHLVLQRKIVPKATGQVNPEQGKSARYHFIINGYIRDLGTGDGLPDVSIYEKQTLSSTLTGDFGYYELRVTSHSPDIEVKLSRQAYRDTMVKLRYAGNGLVDLNLNLQSNNPTPVIEAELVEDSTMLAADSGRLLRADTIQPRLVWVDSSKTKKRLRVEETQVGKWLVGNFQKIAAKNITRDSIYRDWQVTFVPPIGTNGLLSGVVTNKLSVNLLAGYNGGLRGAEFGGLFNILRKDMVGAQFAGLGNLVGGNGTGAQFAGLFNTNLGGFNGFQGAMLFNQNFSYFNGVQASVFYNYNHRESSGAQLTVFSNFNRGGMDGFQGSVFANYAGKESRVFQATVFANLANKIQGVQLGILNLSNRMTGSQIGILNVSRKITGMQLGILNIADSLNGVAIGLISFIRNGEHQLEMSLNENRQYGLAYRSGMKKLYTNLMVTTQLPMYDTNTLMTYGFGIGTSNKLSNTFRITTDLTAHHMSFNFRSSTFNLNTRLAANLEVKIAKGFALFAGASLNHLFADISDPHYDSVFRNFGSEKIWEEAPRKWLDGNIYAQHAWIGYQFGLRLL